MRTSLKITTKNKVLEILPNFEPKLKEYCKRIPCPHIQKKLLTLSKNHSLCQNCGRKVILFFANDISCDSLRCVCVGHNWRKTDLLVWLKIIVCVFLCVFTGDFHESNTLFENDIHCDCLRCVWGGPNWRKIDLFVWLKIISWYWTEFQKGKKSTLF